MGSVQGCRVLRAARGQLDGPTARPAAAAAEQSTHRGDLLTAAEILTERLAVSRRLVGVPKATGYVALGTSGVGNRLVSHRGAHFLNA